MGTSNNFRSRLARMEAVAAAHAGKVDPWTDHSFVLRVYLFDGNDTPESDVPRHPNGSPVTLEDLRAHFADRPDLAGLAGDLLRAEGGTGEAARAIQF